MNSRMHVNTWLGVGVIGVVAIGLLFSMGVYVYHADRVAATSSNAVYSVRVTRDATSSSPGERVTFSIDVTNNDPEGRELTPGVTAYVDGLQVTGVSDSGKYDSANEHIRWESTGVFHGQTHSFTFDVITPDTVGTEYCVKGEVFGLPLISSTACNTVVAAPTATPTSVEPTEPPKVIATPEAKKPNVVRQTAPQAAPVQVQQTPDTSSTVEESDTDTKDEDRAVLSLKPVPTPSGLPRAQTDPSVFARAVSPVVSFFGWVWGVLTLPFAN